MSRNSHGYNKNIVLPFQIQIPIRNESIYITVREHLINLGCWDKGKDQFFFDDQLLWMINEPYPEHIKIIDRFLPIVSVIEKLSGDDSQMAEILLRSQSAMSLIQVYIKQQKASKSKIIRDKTALYSHLFDLGGKEFIEKLFKAAKFDESVVVLVLIFYFMADLKFIYNKRPSFGYDSGDFENEQDDGKSLFGMIQREIQMKESPPSSKESKNLTTPNSAPDSDTNCDPNSTLLSFKEKYKSSSSNDIATQGSQIGITRDNFEFDPNTFYLDPVSGALTNMPQLRDGDIISPLTSDQIIAYKIANNKENCDPEYLSSDKDNHLNKKNDDDISFLVENLHVVKNKAIKYLNSNDGNLYKSIVDLIYNYTDEIKLENKKASKSQTTFSGGRVQYGGSKPNPINLTSNLKTSKSIEEPKYKYDENSESAKELKSFYYANEEFQKINEDFLIKALIHFEGDYMKVIQILLLLLEKKAEHYSFSLHPNKPVQLVEIPPDSSSNIAQTLKKSSKVPTTRKLQPTDTNVSVSSSKKPVQKPQTSIHNDGSKYLRKVTIDLHNYLVDEAMELTARELKNWWAEELKQREYEGLFNKYGSSIQFVEPLVIITGRGIHSEKGPRIKPQVEKYLTQNKFNFTEMSAGYVVTGKRKP